MDKLRQSPMSRKDARSFVRLLTHAAVELTFDAQGRTRIPSYLLEYAGLRKEAVIAGTIERVEIWDRERYHAYMKNVERSGDQLAEALTELGI